MATSNIIDKLNPCRVLDVLAWKFYTHDNFSSAIFLWKISEKLSYRPCSTFGGLARSFFHIGKNNLVEKYFIKLKDVEKETATDWRHFEQVALVLDKKDIAISALKKAYSLDRTDPELVSNLLTALTSRKLVAELIELIEEIANQKRFYELNIQAIESLIAVGQSHMAIKQLLSERESIPTDVFNHLMFKTYIVTQDPTIALDICNAVPMTADNAHYFQTLAGCMYRLNQIKEAVKVVAELLNYNITDRFTTTAIMILFKAGNYEQAKKVVANHVKNPAESCMLNIWLEQAIGQPENADTIFNELMNKGNFNKISNFHHGISGLSFESLSNNQVEDIKNLESKYSHPLVSIILTCFNDEKFLKRAITSIYGQGISNFELFILDDASTDNTFKLAKEYAEKDNRIKALKNDINSGPYFSKNRAIHMAKGEFLAFHDADDVSHPQRLITQIKTLIEKQKDNVFATMCYHIRICEESGKIIERSFNFLTPSPISLVMPREDFLKTYGAFDCVRAGGDSELIRRIQAHQGEQAVYLIEYPLYLASFREGSLTTHSNIGIVESSNKDSVRHRYRYATDGWHDLIRVKQVNPFKSFPDSNPTYEIPQELQISKEAIAQL